MKRNILRAGFGVLLLGVPAVTFAQDIYRLTRALGGLIQILIPILASVALLVFFWGLVKYIARAGDEEKAKEGKSIMLYGIIALFVLFSIWGILAFIGNSFGINGPGGVIRPPSVQL